MAQKEIVNAIAGASLASDQFKFVFVDGSDGEKVKLVGTAGGTATCLGVLQNAPADDGLAFVAVEGVVEVYAGAAIEPFDYVTSTNAGLATPAVTSGHHVLGRYEPLVEGTAAPDAASGDLIRVRLFANKSVVVPA
jgi:hypothetical protein